MDKKVLFSKQFDEFFKDYVSKWKEESGFFKSFFEYVAQCIENSLIKGEYAVIFGLSMDEHSYKVLYTKYDFNNKKLKFLSYYSIDLESDKDMNFFITKYISIFLEEVFIKVDKLVEDNKILLEEHFKKEDGKE
ncbi:MAG: hypothetical protein ACOCP8_04350 [archaeon]